MDSYYKRWNVIFLTLMLILGVIAAAIDGLVGVIGITLGALISYPISLAIIGIMRS